MAFTPDGNGAMTQANGAPSVPATGPALQDGGQGEGALSDAALLSKFKVWKKESFDQRWIFERVAMRNIWYLLGRQWIYFDSRRGQWQDKRMAKWMPRPVTNVLKKGLNSLRSNYASIDYNIGARPNGQSKKNIIAAGVADDYKTILWDEHKMPQVLDEHDFWHLATGNAWLHTYVDYDLANGSTAVDIEACASCQQEYRADEIANAGQKCPGCQQDAAQVMQKTGKQIKDPLPKGCTVPLSLFEIAYPLMHERFDLTPYIIRMRWRDKSYYEQNEELKPLIPKLDFSKAPRERTMQIFKSLPFQSDLGVAPPYFAAGGANAQSEGLVEYDVWHKPCADYPDGLVVRFAGDTEPVVIHSEREGLPGPLPYHSSNGNPRFTFHHTEYSHEGGRSLGSSLVDMAVHKQDQLNQIDSHALMILGRMANPGWSIPKGTEVDKFSGEPGWILRYNANITGGAKPEKFAGSDIPGSAFSYREIVKAEAEELLGTFEIMEGQRPQGTSAYASMSFLYERAMGRHTSSFKSRGSAVKEWYKDALDIEREFGPEQRSKTTSAPNRGWAFQTFQKADLDGDIDIIIEDGAPKNVLTERANIDHLNSLMMLDPNDADQRQTIYEKFGEDGLSPTTDAQVQEAWRNMDKLKTFLNDPAAINQAAQSGQGPLQFKPWYDANIHRRELIKWALSDEAHELFDANPEAETLVKVYLSEIDQMLAMQAAGMIDPGGIGVPIPMGPPPGQGQPPKQTPQQQGPQGRQQQMRNSNQNAAGAGPHSSSVAGTTQPGSGTVQGSQ